MHVLFTGASKAGAAGMRAFLKRHPTSPGTRPSSSTSTRSAPATSATRAARAPCVTLRSHPQLVALCDQIAEDDDDAGPIVSRSASDASAATAAGFAAITVTCRDRLDYASGRVDERALERAEDFCVELIERLDAEVGPSIVAPVEATALSEPEAT